MQALTEARGLQPIVTVVDLDNLGYFVRFGGTEQAISLFVNPEEAEQLAERLEAAADVLRSRRLAGIAQETT